MMKSFAMQILLLMLLRDTTQICSEGCLKCSPDNICELCDQKERYVLTDGSCLQDTIPDCEMYSLEGECLQCISQYYLDSVTNQCIKVPDQFQITNCAIYEIEGACSICEPEFYLSGLTCSPTTLKIDNCKVYQSIDKCKECSEGYIVQQNSTVCLEMKNVDNCQTFTSIKCDTCQDGYYLQSHMQQLRIPYLLKSSLASKEVRALKASQTSKIPTSNNCVSTIPKNCDELKDFQTCLICKNGYFLKENDCTLNPITAIPNCKEYSSDTRCKECNNGYRLTPAPQYHCTEVESVSHCQIFNGSSFITECLECKERFYLKSENFCDQRTRSVEFCLTYEVQKDGCAKCEANYHLTSDHGKCLQETPGCSSYLESDFNSEKLVCDECEDNKYLNEENLCTLGTTNNCQVYERTFDQCKLCENNYFLNSNLECEQHPSIEGCSNYDPYIKNKCNDCEFDHFLLTLQTSCQSVEVENCRIHKTIDHCAECDEGYSLLNNGQCEELETDQNCLIGEYGLCIKCKEGYMLDQGICKVQLIYEKDACQLNEMPIDYQSSLQCTSKDDLIKLGIQEAAYNVCKKFELDEDSNYKCLECNDGHFLNQNGQCVQPKPIDLCNDDGTFFYRDLNYKFRKNKENLMYVTSETCLRIAKNDDTINTCKKYGISKEKFNVNKEVQYGCLECIDDPASKKYFQVLDIDSNRSTLLKESPNIYWKSEFQCTLKDEQGGDYSSVVWGDVITDATNINNCEYFYPIINGKLGCLKCKNGFSGTILNPSIDRCLKYDDTNLKCVKCQENFLLDDDQKSCVFKASTDTTPSYITNCKREAFDEDKCYECNQGFSLTNNGSSCIAIKDFATIDNCIAYEHNSDTELQTTKCEACADDHYLTDDKLNCWPYGNNCIKPANATQCEICEMNYELQTGSCVLVSDCEYNESNSSTCIVSTNFNITSTNKCTLVTFEDCIEFDQEEGKCTKCKDGKYLFEDLKAVDGSQIACIDNDTFPQSIVNLNPVHTNDNCKEFQVIKESEDYKALARYGCKVCKDGYHLKDSEQTDLSSYNCVKDNHVDKGDSDVQDILLADNTFSLNCSIYDLLKEKCSSCKVTNGVPAQTYYMSINNCCQVGKYYKGNDCVDIPNANGEEFPNCNKVVLSDNQQSYKCIGCKAGYTLIDDYCSADGDNCDHISYGTCRKKNDFSCQTYDITQDICEECISTHYMVPNYRGKCCAVNNFYHSDGQCKTISTDLTIVVSNPQTDEEIEQIANLKAKCKKWDDVSKICLLCVDDHTFQGKICVKTDDIYKNCNKVNKQNNLCEQCKDDFNLIEDYGVCCSSDTPQRLDITAGTCINVVEAKKVTNCSLYENNTNSLCEQCEDEFKLLEDKVCCPQDKMFFNPKTNQSDCIYPGEDIDYCLQFDFKKDSDNIRTGNYSCKTCYQNYSSEFNSSGDKFCCPLGEKYNSSSKGCEDNTTLDCYIYSNDSTQCEMCNFDKQIIANVCTTLSDNCHIQGASSSSCQICKLRYISDTNAGNTCKNDDKDKLKGKNYCASYDQSVATAATEAAPADCTGCLLTPQINSNSDDSCCPLGTYEESANNCQPIPIENCAIWDSTKCTSCVQDENKCTMNYDFFATMNAEYKARFLFTTHTGDLRISINEKYYLGTDTKQNCCQFGNYFNGKECIKIPVDDCKKFDVKNFKCKECNNNYILIDNLCKPLNQDQCNIKNTIDLKYYSSNNNCCLEGTYWNEEENICEDIPDKKCLKSDDGVNCKTCDTDFKPQSILKSYYQLHYRITLENCPHIHKHKSFYQCVSDTEYTTIQSYNNLVEVQYAIENCAEVDYEELKCKKCKENSYKPDGIPICCPQDQVAVKVENRYICRNLSTIDTECLIFDGNTNLCKKCISCTGIDKVTKCSLSGGICCPRFEHYNLITKKCENMKLGDCQDVDLETRICRKCPEGFYFYHSACVQEGYKFTDQEKFDAIVKIDGINNPDETVKCLQTSPQGHCAVCNLQKGQSTEYYYLLGKCLQHTTLDTNNTLILGDGLQKQDDAAESACKMIDQYGQCKECIDGYILNNGRCCQEGREWSGTACNDISISITNCSTEVYTKDSGSCSACSSGSLISFEMPSDTTKNIQQCSTTFDQIFNSELLWAENPAIANSEDDVIALKRIEFLQNCIKFNKGECQQCKPGYVLTIINQDITVAQDGSKKLKFKKCVEDNTIDNCVYYNPSNTSDCLQCNGKKALKDSNKKCEGEELKNCLLSDVNGCLQCEDGFLIRKIIDYTQASQPSKNVCWFNTMTPCVRLEDGTTQCAECDDGFILPYSQDGCIVDSSITVADCLRIKVTSFADNSVKECQRCDRGHYNNTGCTDVTNANIVVNCRVYSADGVCSECENGFYLQNQNRCVPDDQIYYNGNNVSWKIFNYENCTDMDIQVSGTESLQKIVCKACEADYYLTNGLCCPKNSFGVGNTCYQVYGETDQNCQQFNTDGTCKICKNYFNLVGGQCKQCIKDFHLIGTECCSENSKTDDSTCYDVSSKYDQNCKEYDTDNKCKECYNDFYLVNDQCCSLESIQKGEQCYKSNNVFGKKCKLFDTNGQCKECQDGYYQVNGGCCEDGKYYNSILKLCLTITSSKYVDSSSSLSCLQLNEDNECQKCSNANARIFNGICYNEDKVIEIASQQQQTPGTDPYPKCKIVKNYECTSCDTGYTLGGGVSSTKCCGKSDDNYYYDNQKQTCIQTQSQCKNFDHETNTCIQCNDSYYSTGTFCCAIDKYYNYATNDCADISSLSDPFKNNCSKISEKDLELKQCTQCATNYSLIDGKCYLTTTIKDNCKEKQNQYCLNCSDNKTIAGVEESICCPENQTFNPLTQVCEADTNMQNCEYKLSSDLCSKCKDGYYLAKEDTCCGNGKRLISTECESDISIEHCQEWKEITDGVICTLCKEDYYPQDYIDGENFTSKCCKKGQLLEPLTKQCVDIKFFYKYKDENTCDKFNIQLYSPYYRAPTCLKIPSSSSNYITTIYECPNNQNFSEDDQECKDFSTTEFPNCTQVFNGKCLACSGDNLLIEGKCCTKGQYLNDQKECSSSTDKGLETVCEEFYNECPPDQFEVDCTTFEKGKYCKTCNSSTYLTYNYKCCTEKYYWSKTDGECKEYTQVNVGEKFRSNLLNECKKFGKDFICKECETHTLTDDKKNCCDTNKYFINVDGECIEKFQIPTECKKYDHEKYECLECKDTSYLTEGKCCTFGNYYERKTKTCKTISNDMLLNYPNCNQYDENKKCLGCKEGFKINTDKICIEIPENCDDFDATSLKCSKCKSEYQVSDKGNCCETNNLDSYGVCKNIETQVTISNCQNYSNGRCKDCKADHYFVQSACCPNESYLRDGVCCAHGTYLTNGVCCNYGTYFTNGQCCPNGQIYDPLSTEDLKCKEDSGQSNTEESILEKQQKELNTIAHCKNYGYKQDQCTMCKDGYILVNSLWSVRCIKMQIDDGSKKPLLTNCVQYKGFYDSAQKVKCTQCKTGNQESDEAQAEKFYKLEIEEKTDNDIQIELKEQIQQDNCTVYHIINKFEDSTFLCIKCSDNYYLNDQDLCIQRNQNNIDHCNAILPLDKDECTQCKKGFYVNYLKICEQIPITNCIKYDKERELCLKCDDDQNNTTITDYDQSADPANKDYKHMILQYYQVGDHIRSKCVLQKHTQIGYPNHYKGFINKCETDNNQNSTKAINLDSFYDKWYSYNYCTDNNKIPIVLVKAGRDQTGMPYGISHYLTNDISEEELDLDNIDKFVTDGGEFDDTKDFGLSTKCISNFKDIFTGYDVDALVNPVENCGLLMTNIEMKFETDQGKEANPDLSILSTFCTACKTNFKPTFNGILPIVVNKCEQIPNCNLTASGTPKILNGCSECSKNTSDVTKNYTFQVDDDGNVDYTQCVQTNDLNCKLLNKDGTCKYCNQGHMPNYDGMCTVYRQHNCDDSQFSFQSGFTIDNFEYVLAYLGLHKGCENCKDGYKGLLVETKKLVCSESSTLQDSSINDDSKVYDSKCQLYGVINGKASCIECVPEYILNVNYKCIQSSLENCKIVLTEAACSQCSDNYILKDGQCTQQVIENCKEHELNDQGVTICSKCEDGNYLKNQQCIPGDINFCKTYNDVPRCIKCQDNYVLVTLQNNVQQCSLIRQDIHPNCVQYKSQAFNANKVECSQCSSLKYLPIYHELEQNICLQLETVDNCIKYDKEPLFIHSSLKCLECEDKYVLNGQVCEERKLNIENCKEYSKFEQQCLECNEGFYLSSNNEECIQKPIGISNCDVYSDYNECKHCNNHTYLLDNKCLQVQTQIQNCKYYKNATNCVLCDLGFILENNECRQFQVSCLTYLSSTECATCPQDQGIIYKDGKRICSAFNVVQFCDKHDQIEPYACRKCLNGYFLYEEIPRNKCVKVVTQVNNCEEYYGPEDCSKCVEGYTLSIDQRSCLEINFNDKCSSRVESQPYCVKCEQGYNFNDEQQCVKETNNIPEGCLGLNKNGECQVCLSGYYQNPEKECIKI